jgi:hypothetical protein
MRLQTWFHDSRERYWVVGDSLGQDEQALASLCDVAKKVSSHVELQLIRRWSTIRSLQEIEHWKEEGG